MASNGLEANKLDAIRSIGHNILLAKKSAKKDPSDNEQLLQIRATVDSLIAAETSASKIMVQQVSNKTAGIPDNQQAAIEARRNAAQTAAWDVVSKLRQDAGQLQRTSKAAAKRRIYSSGLPVGEQRGRLYERWANKLEAILAKNNSDRVSKLLAFRDQLQANQRGVITSLLGHKTPTLQALPWEWPESKAKKN